MNNNFINKRVYYRDSIYGLNNMKIIFDFDNINNIFTNDRIFSFCKYLYRKLLKESKTIYDAIITKNPHIISIKNVVIPKGINFYSNMNLKRLIKELIQNLCTKNVRLNGEIIEKCNTLINSYVIYYALKFFNLDIGDINPRWVICG